MPRPASPSAPLLVRWCTRKSSKAEKAHPVLTGGARPAPRPVLTRARRVWPGRAVTLGTPFRLTQLLALSLYPL